MFQPDLKKFMGSKLALNSENHSFSVSFPTFSWNRSHKSDQVHGVFITKFLLQKPKVLQL